MTKAKNIPYRVGRWLPSDQAVLETWLTTLLERAKAAAKPLEPAVEALKELIETDAAAYMFFHLMFTQVPRKPPYNRNPAGGPQVRNYHEMLRMINHVMTEPPPYNDTGLVGFPINAILDWSMGTEAGYAAFLDDKVNAALKGVLDEWGIYLKSPDSASGLNEDPERGWLGDDAMVHLVQALPEYALYSLEHGHDMPADEARAIFIESFHCEPAKLHYGYGSWDEFFVRTFRDGVRPVASGEDEIANACESAPFAIARDVELRDQYWIKGQPYSLAHMLDNDPWTEQFVGGTIYQAFLSALSYHCWNSPVDGVVKKVQIIQGTYYSEAPMTGFYNPANPSDPLNSGHGGYQPLQSPDDAGPNESQGYITEVATRALIFIESSNPKIGLMAFLAVGMAEVSSCDVTVREGQEISKGDPIGKFHFGGSTHCLIFRKGVELAFDLHGQTPGLDAYNIAVCSRIARVLGPEPEPEASSCS